MIKTIIKSVVIAEAISCVFCMGIGCGYSPITALDPDKEKEFRGRFMADLKTKPLDKRIAAASFLVGERFGRHLLKDSIVV